jgi:hypothetical protein
MRFGDLVLHRLDRLVETLQMLSQAIDARFGDRRKIGVRPRQRDQFIDPADALGGDKAELGEMTAQLTLMVRCSTSSSRVLCSISTACCAALLIGTKRITGRDIASQIAAASIPSFLPRLT